MTHADDRRFSDWMADIAGVTGARLGDKLSGGNANITRPVESDQGRFILRHPPPAAISPKAAAGIEREFRVLAAIQGEVPAPAAVAWCDDPSVLGVCFSVTGFIEGVAITETVPAAYGAGVDAINKIGEGLVDGLSALHNVAWQGRLPENFGRPEGFLRRQIERWVAIRQADSVRSLPHFTEIADWLLANLPETGAGRIVHCDYHLDNCLFDRHSPQLNAIIDWEMATIGDPLIDLGLLLMFWRRDESLSPGFRFVQRISNRPDCIAPDRLADRWSARTGISTENLDYYRVFAFWRLAAIVEGAYLLHRHGKLDNGYVRGLAEDVPNLLLAAARLINQGG